MASKENVNPPDYKDPFAPRPGSTELVKCCHCSEVYPENEVKWEPIHVDGLWVCKNWPTCKGDGVGWDIFRLADLALSS